MCRSTLRESSIKEFLSWATKTQKLYILLSECVCIYRNILITWVSFEKENQNLPGSRLHIEAILQNFKPPQRKKYINANKIHKSCVSPFPRPPKINKINGCCLITPVLSCEKRKISNYTTALVWPQRYKDSLTSSVSFVL